MSFHLICLNCGAPSSPATGVCPFCKSVLTSRKTIKESPTLTAISKLFDDGRIDQALSLVRAAEEKRPNLLKNIRFVILYVKILIEAEGPSSKIRSLLAEALLDHPQDPLLLEYLEVIDARRLFSHEKEDLGEKELANLVRRSPDNVHALFLLGSHLFWVGKETQRSLKYLERCHKLRPNFLRATACLAAIYSELGLKVQASRLFRECMTLESNGEMKAYFKKLATAP